MWVIYLALFTFQVWNFHITQNQLIQLAIIFYQSLPPIQKLLQPLLNTPCIPLITFLCLGNCMTGKLFFQKGNNGELCTHEQFFSAEWQIFFRIPHQLSCQSISCIIIEIPYYYCMVENTWRADYPPFEAR